MCVFTPDNAQQFAAFRKLSDSDAGRDLFQVSISKDESIADIAVDVSVPLVEMDESDFRYASVALMLKELSDGFFSFREHSIVNQVGDLSQEQKFKIGQDLVIKIK